jgi:murein tripeptide amidase MpaA
MKIGKIGHSFGGLNIPLVTITDNVIEEDAAFNNNLRYQRKKIIFVEARIHPGESNSSYMAEGFIRYLCSEACSFLREQAVFKIVPMMNPDGVTIGNYRTGLSGRDFNR